MRCAVIIDHSKNKMSYQGHVWKMITSLTWNLPGRNKPKKLVMFEHTSNYIMQILGNNFCLFYKIVMSTLQESLYRDRDVSSRPVGETCQGFVGSVHVSFRPQALRCTDGWLFLRNHSGIHWRRWGHLEYWFHTFCFLAFVTRLSDFILILFAEFFLYRIIFFVSGIIIMTLASSLSKSLVFYYSSAMAVGIILVILMVLFQVVCSFCTNCW